MPHQPGHRDSHGRFLKKDQWNQESAGQVKPEILTPDQEAERAIVQEIVDFYTFAKSYYDAQLRAENEELEFEGVDMWSADAREKRDEHTDDATGRVIPAKPTLSVNLLDQNVQQVVAEARQARLALTVKPKTGLSTTKTAGYFKGLVRNIQVEGGALSIRLWALERAAKVGRGGYRYVAEFANDGDFDLDLVPERILDYSTVTWDPYSQRADKKDAEKCLVSDLMSEDERQRKWPHKPIIPSEGAFASEDHDWFPADDKKGYRACRIATYYKVEHTIRKLGHHPSFGRGWIGEGPEDSKIPVMPPECAALCQAEAPDTRIRDVDERTVMIYITDGTQELERHPWHGRFIPVIELPGKEYFVKGKRRWKGIIANAKDLLTAINVLISAATELAGQMPRSPYIMYEGQDEGFEDEWDDLFVTNRTRVHVRALDLEGKPKPLPERQQQEAQIQGLMLLIRMMHEMYHAVTGSVAPQLRAINPTDRSGKAIDLLQRQGAAGTSNYLDNLATIAMLYEGEVLVDAIPHYYDTEGRILNVSGEDSEDEVSIMIKVPFTRDEDGNPVAVPCPACKGTGTQRPMMVTALGIPNPFMPDVTCQTCGGSRHATKQNMPKVWEEKEVEYVDFADGQFKVAAVVDRSFQVKQEEALAGMQQLSQAAPDMVPIYADLWVEAMGFSGSKQISERIKARTEAGSDEVKDIPEAYRGRFLRLQSQHQQAMQALQEAQKMLESDTIKTAGQKEIAMIRGALQGKVEQIKLQGKMLQMTTSAQADERLEVLRGRLQSLQEESQQRHEAMLATVEHQHEIVLALLKERGEKEVERHSVELHDAAAQRAAEQADLSATGADVRKELAAQAAHARGEASAERSDARGEAASERADARAETAAEAAARRDRDMEA